MTKKAYKRLDTLHEKGSWTIDELNELSVLYREFFVHVTKAEFPNVEFGKLTNL